MDEETQKDAGEEAPDTNPERQGPGEETSPGGPASPPSPDEEQGPSGPPHEAIPGDSGQVPSPQQN